MGGWPPAREERGRATRAGPRGRAPRGRPPARAMAAAEGAAGAPARLAHPLGFFGAPAGEYARGARASRALPGRLLAVHAAWGLDLLVATYADPGPTPLLSLHLLTFR